MLVCSAVSLWVCVTAIVVVVEVVMVAVVVEVVLVEKGGGRETYKN